MAADRALISVRRKAAPGEPADNRQVRRRGSRDIHAAGARLI
jgi:hypothetical protein